MTLRDIGQIFISSLKYHWGDLQAFVSKSKFYILGSFLVTLLLVTPLHELSHCVAVWSFGGEVTHLSFIPAVGEWGRVEYMMDEGMPFEVFLVYLAPLVLALALMFFCLIFALFWRARLRIGKILFFNVYTIAAAEFAYTSKGILLGAGDLAMAFPEPSGWVVLFFFGASAGFVMLGFPLQKKLLGKDGLGGGLFCFLAAGGLIAVWLL